MTHDFTLPLLNKDDSIENEDTTIHFTLCITATKVVEDEKDVEAECKKIARSYVCS